jgi:hypothetical protein
MKAQLRSTTTSVIETAPTPSPPLVRVHALGGNCWIAALAGVNESSIGRGPLQLKDAR